MLRLPFCRILFLFTVLAQGTEDLSGLSSLSQKPIMGLLNVPEGVSRVHASRRVFQHLADTESDLAIIHHALFPQAAEVRSTKAV